MGLTSEFQALAEQGPGAFDADPSNGEYNPDSGTVEAPQEAAASLAEDTLRQGAVPDWLAQSDTGSGSNNGNTLLGGGNQTLLLAGVAVAVVLIVGVSS
ncbi:hypothetical protein SAMN05216388_1001226 [Halorientalis persicus]|uniref:Uncharacterized protein n=1 Tax=Halorientalis persicus TaxID=1367881 RepID=A0A1H8DA48_9EURY|nr:hypothetical protein [Halorientalis persicus]SEN04142.1 hypothetical protein SAMN05216388_1001226 [Halorientalis persicus]